MGEAREKEKEVFWKWLEKKKGGKVPVNWKKVIVRPWKKKKRAAGGGEKPGPAKIERGGEGKGVLAAGGRRGGKKGASRFRGNKKVSGQREALRAHKLPLNR